MIKRLPAVLAATSLAIIVAASPAGAAVVTDTDAPARIRVGAPYTEIPITVIIDRPGDWMSADLVDPRYGSLASDFAPAPDPSEPRKFKLRVAFYGWQIEAWGAKRWDFAGYAQDFTPFNDSRATDMRAHSMLGLAASRSGSTINIRGALRAYNSVTERYHGWSGRPVAIQRWSSSGWLTLKTVSTDRNGNIATSVGVPFRTTLRLATGDTAGIWGATSTESTL
jgi:hypothetical protein